MKNGWTPQAILQLIRDQYADRSAAFKAGLLDYIVGNPPNPGHEVAGLRIVYDHGDPRRAEYIAGRSEGWIVLNPAAYADMLKAVQQ